jgi:hypothetical protein
MFAGSVHVGTYKLGILAGKWDHGTAMRVTRPRNTATMTPLARSHVHTNEAIQLCRDVNTIQNFSAEQCKWSRHREHRFRAIRLTVCTLAIGGTAITDPLIHLHYNRIFCCCCLDKGRRLVRLRLVSNSILHTKLRAHCS